MGTFNIDLTGHKVVKYPTATATTAVASGTSANTYNASYTEFVAASGIATDFYLVGVFLRQSDGTTRETAVKVGVGAAASEVDIFEGGVVSSNVQPTYFSIDPIKISANARVAVNVYDDEAAANDIEVSLNFKVPA